MGWLHSACLALLLCGCASLAAQRPSAETLSKIESRQLPPNEVIARVAAQMGDLLIYEPQALDAHRPPRRALDSLFFVTRPRATEIGGVCASEVVIVSFDRAGPARGAETAMRASSFSVSPRFALRDTAPMPDLLEPEPISVDEAACARFDPYAEAFFHAPDAPTARDAALLLSMLGSIDPTTFTLTCDQGDCAQRLAAARATRLSQASRCPFDALQFCYALDLDSNRITIRARHQASAGEAFVWRIASVHVEEMIVLSHERID